MGINGELRGPCPFVLWYDLDEEAVADGYVDAMGLIIRWPSGPEKRSGNLIRITVDGTERRITFVQPKDTTDTQTDTASTDEFLERLSAYLPGNSRENPSVSERPTPTPTSLFEAMDLSGDILTCNTDLREINRAIDKITSQTPPDKWQSIINKFAEVRKAHRSHYTTGVSYYRGSGPFYGGSLNVRLLRDNEKLIEKLSARIQRTGERYSVDRRRLERQRSKYEEHLVKCLREAGVAEGLIYTGSKIVVCVNSVMRTSESVSVIVGAYLTEPPSRKDTFGSMMWFEHMKGKGKVLSADHVERHAFAYGMDGDSLGSPTRIEFRRFSRIAGIVVALTYEAKPKAETDGLRLIIEQAAFNSDAEIEFEIPYDEITCIPDTITFADQVPDSPMNDAMGRLPKRLEVIQCQREGMHLMVPAELNIHGTKIEADMLLDTGASVTVISNQLYSKGNTIPFEKLQKQEILTASGPIECPIDAFEVSTIAYAKKVEVAILSDCVPLLGANYFAGHVFTVDLDGQCIYVHFKSE